jgi:hypothetical protein
MNYRACVRNIIVPAALIVTAAGCNSLERDETDLGEAHHRMLEDSYDRRFGRQYEGKERVDPHSRPGTGFATPPQDKR